MSESNAKKAAARKAEQRRRLVQRYKRERHEERSARFTGKSPFGALGGHKMEAFRRTEYGDDKVRTLASRWTREAQGDLRKEKQHATDKFKRIEYVRNKGHDFEPFKEYFAPETRARREEFLNRIDALKARFSVIGPGKDWRDLISK